MLYSAIQPCTPYTDSPALEPVWRIRVSRRGRGISGGGISWGKLELTQTLSQVMIVVVAVRIIVIGFSFYNAMTHTPCLMSHGQRVEVYVILDKLFF